MEPHTRDVGMHPEVIDRVEETAHQIGYGRDAVGMSIATNTAVESGKHEQNIRDVRIHPEVVDMEGTAQQIPTDLGAGGEAVVDSTHDPHPKGKPPHAPQRLNTTQLDSTQLNSTQPNSTRLDLTQNDNLRYVNTTQHDSTRLDLMNIDDVDPYATISDLIETCRELSEAVTDNVVFEDIAVQNESGREPTLQMKMQILRPEYIEFWAIRWLFFIGEKDTGKAILRMLPIRLYNQLELLIYEQQSAAEKYVYDSYRDEALRHMVEHMHASLSVIMGGCRG